MSLRNAFPLCPILLVSLLGGGAMQAHPGGHGTQPRSGARRADTRMWRDAHTGSAVEGSLLAVQKDRVLLELPGGGRTALLRSHLTAEDQQVVRLHEARVQALNTLTPRRPSPSGGFALAGEHGAWLVLSLLAGSNLALGLLLFRRRHPREGLLAVGLGSLVLGLCACGGSGAAGTSSGGSPSSPTPGTGSVPANDPATLAAAFAPFSSHVSTHADGTWFYVASDGLPDHSMMTGITSWQQQVPTPQPYTGTNAWQIPLQPVLAASPISARTSLYTGAIALAVNGVPIFNAMNNRGDDAYLYGELDQWGGHAGRADDYHYHIAPLHLQATVGTGKAIAYALDGFALYGETEPDGSAVKPLDSLNGHADGVGGYHYHGTRVYPYINGGMRGVVQVSGDQIVPQPHTTPFRPWLTPLAGAVITGFAITGPNAYRLTFTQNGATGTVSYALSNTGSVSFTFVDPDGTTRTASYQR